MNWFFPAVSPEFYPGVQPLKPRGMLFMTMEESKTPAPKNLSQAWPFGEWRAKTTSSGDPNAGLEARGRKVLILPLPSLESAMGCNRTEQSETKQRLEILGIGEKQCFDLTVALW